MSKEDLWLYKTAALLHDPPDKAWVITGKISVPEVLRKHDKSIKAHEDRAWQLGDKILKESNLNKAVSDYKTYFFSIKITHADIFAAGVDRQLLYSVIPEERKHELVKSWNFKNIFDPSKKVQEKIDELIPSENNLNDFIKDLNNILKEVKNSKYAYFTLYALYELIWIYHNLPISPSDTRMPTHSVFDHNYATATAMNFFIASQSEIPEGLVITIDIPGVQEYISASRKLRDLRISSYLVSLIAWKTVEEFVNLYGPDILILPTARFNPFFYTYLLGILNKEIKDTKKLKDIFKFIKLKINIAGEPSEIEIISEDMFPKFSVIPPTITFVLPPIQYLAKDEEFIQLMKKYGIDELNKEKLKELVKRIFEQIWLRIYEVVKESANKITNEKYKLIKNIINNLDSIKDKYNFEKPPFDLRIIIIDIKDDIISKGISDNLKIYETIFDKINIELSKFKHLKVDPFIKTNLTELTTKIYKEEDEYKNLLTSERAFDYCTVCGKLPAVLNVASSKEIIMYRLKEQLDESFEPYFAENEKFCPYCLIKRIITIPIELDKERTIFESILNEFFNKLGFKFDIRVPSLADISTYEFKEKILDAIADRIPLNEINKIEGIVSEDIKTEELEKIGFKPIHYAWKYPEKTSDRLNRKIADERTKAILETVFLRKESEMIFLKNNERKRKWSNFAKDYGINISPGTYYVLIRSDADNMGKIVSGEAFLPLSLDLNYNEIEKIRKDCLKEYLKKSYNLQNIINERELENKLTMLINSMNINSVISFSYHSSVSKSLMINSLIDNAIVEKFDGFTIYAGGDDLLVISPVSKALIIVNLTSKNFQNGNHNGFYQIGTNYFISALLTGRSYVMYIAHYMYPMYAIINSSNRYLDEFSKESKWSISGKEYQSKCDKSPSLTKNSLTLVYSPRGSETYAILPLYMLDKLRMDKQDDKYENILDILREIIEDLINEKYSTRLIYNLIEKENLKTWDILMTRQHLLKEDIIKNVVERHIRVPEEEKRIKIEAFEKYINLISNIYKNKEGLSNEYEKWLLVQLFKAIRVYWGGLRGV
jgi:CRISPR-associated protein Cmr2